MSVNHHAIQARGLVKTYGGRRALDGLDLSVPSGIVYGFLGRNGAGKTTTMRILAGLVRPEAGSVEILGRPLARHGLVNVGVLIEAPAFYPYLSGRDNLRVLASTGAEPSAGRIEAMLDLVGLQPNAERSYGSYSLGMKQRLGFAAALLNDPELLILDEPANGLDPAGLVQVRELLRQLARAGKTVFVSSHLLAEMSVLADEIAIVDRGRVVRHGPLHELLADSGTDLEDLFLSLTEA